MTQTKHRNSNASRNRVSGGVPSGGEFAAHKRDDSAVTLAHPVPRPPAPRPIPVARPRIQPPAPRLPPITAPTLGYEAPPIQRRPADVPAPDRAYGQDIQAMNYMFDDLEAFTIHGDDIEDIDPLNADARQVAAFQSLASNGYPNSLA